MTESLALINTNGLAAQINEQHALCRSSAENMIVHAIRAGELLSEAQAQCNRGQWIPWIEANCDFSRRAATGYIRIYKHQDKLQTNGKRVSQRFALRNALKLLAEPRENHQLINQSTSNEWYTPPQYIEAARKVLKAIDIDPASCRGANQTIKAEKFYTKEDDGLQHDWPGRVWLNPPYGGLAGKFVAKLIEQFDAGITREAVVLLNSNCIETKWFDPLWNFILCFADHRINFDSDDESDNGPTHGSVFVYLGKNGTHFAREFKQFGHVVRQVSE